MRQHTEAHLQQLSTLLQNLSAQQNKSQELSLQMQLEAIGGGHAEAEGNRCGVERFGGGGAWGLGVGEGWKSKRTLSPLTTKILREREQKKEEEQNLISEVLVAQEPIIAASATAARTEWGGMDTVEEKRSWRQGIAKGGDARTGQAVDGEGKGVSVSHKQVVVLEAKEAQRQHTSPATLATPAAAEVSAAIVPKDRENAREKARVNQSPPTQSLILVFFYLIYILAQICRRSSFENACESCQRC